MKKKIELRCSGISNRTGFRVNAVWHLPNKSTKKMSGWTEDYDPKGGALTQVEYRILVFWSAILWILSNGLFWWITLTLFHTPFWITLGAGIIFALTTTRGGTATLSGLMLFWFDFEARSWHGCEHKTIRLLEEGKPITMKELRRCNRVHIRCGTRFGAFMLIPCLGVLQLFAGLSMGGWAGIGLWSSSLLYFVAPLPFGIFLSYPLQYFLTTSEPNREQLRAGIRLAKKFKAIEEKFISPPT